MKNTIETNELKIMEGYDSMFEKLNQGGVIWNQNKFVVNVVIVVTRQVRFLELPLFILWTQR